jgi:uncharacterized membrane protein YkvA (DUF1232 family)
MPWVWIVLGVIYILSPYDLIPDFIPVRGWIDDLIVLILMIRYIKRLRRDPAQQHARERYGEQQDTSDNFRQTSGSPKTPHEILGVPPSAGQEEIRSAYLNLAARYHPDKVAHLGKEFQEMAEKRFKEIQNAYERLMKP